MNQMIYDLPFRFILEEGSFTAIPELISSWAADRVLLCLPDAAFEREIGLYLEHSLTEDDIRVSSLKCPQSAIDSDWLKEQMKHYPPGSVDLILAYGPKCVLERSQALAVCLGSGKDPVNMAGYDNVTGPVVPVVYIPDGLGYGAEASSHITVYQHEQPFEIDSARLIPCIVVADPILLLHEDPSDIVSGCICTLCMAAEAYRSRSSCAYSDAMAEEALCLCARHLKTCCQHPHELAELKNMIAASLFASLAFNQAGGGGTFILSDGLQEVLNLNPRLTCGLCFQECLNWKETGTRDKDYWIYCRLCPSPCERSEFTGHDLSLLIHDLLEKTGLPSCLREALLISHQRQAAPDSQQADDSAFVLPLNALSLAALHSPHKFADSCGLKQSDFYLLYQRML